MTGLQEGCDVGTVAGAMRFRHQHCKIGTHDLLRQIAEDALSSRAPLQDATCPIDRHNCVDDSVEYRLKASAASFGFLLDYSATRYLGLEAGGELPLTTRYRGDECDHGNQDRDYSDQRGHQRCRHHHPG